MKPHTALSSLVLLAGCWLAPFASGQPARAEIQQYRTETNILYRANADLSDYMKERCRLDVYYPTGTNDFATVVWFHGGGLIGGDRFLPEALKRQGIAVIAPSYRLSPRAKSPAYIEDAAAAVAWTFRHV